VSPSDVGVKMSSRTKRAVRCCQALKVVSWVLPVTVVTAVNVTPSVDSAIVKSRVFHATGSPPACAWRTRAPLISRSA
jgi:hypothetical protein